jgi:hypothetical protein
MNYTRLFVFERQGRSASWTVTVLTDLSDRQIFSPPTQN